jgi:hypothetical protein
MEVRLHGVVEDILHGIFELVEIRDGSIGGGGEERDLCSIRSAFYVVACKVFAFPMPIATSGDGVAPGSCTSANTRCSEVRGQSRFELTQRGQADV